jgi:hypothetical protein
MTQYVDISPGMRLRAEITGRVYEVVNVDGDDVFLDRGCPISKDELEEDIGDGIEVLN